MPLYRPGTQQWTLDVTISHAPQFHHKVVAQTLGRHGDWHVCGEWSWTGIGVPSPVVEDMITRLSAVLTEHLLTRYGIQGSLDMAGHGPREDPF